MKEELKKSLKIAVVGLGYVGLPLVIEFAKKGFTLVGFDINTQRVQELKNGNDRTLEVPNSALADTTATFTATKENIADCNIFIITVPTPVNKANQPDLTPLIKASQLVGSVMAKHALVIYESTVYPGATEEVCVPELEQFSGMKYNEDFFVGYSPERINPGDPERHLTTIKKITSGSNDATAVIVDVLYDSIITAGTFRASSIKVAEAAKVIENTQRDVNIALINELAMIFNKMNIDTLEVLEAAGTKWNFLPFRPGLVGGHCIGVDPYYLTYKAQEIGYHPQIILAGRRVNDGMARYVSQEIVKGMTRNRQTPADCNALILGYTFKENCPDTRNTKVVDIIDELEQYGIQCNVYDPCADVDERIHNRIVELDDSNLNSFDVVVIAVAHDEFKNMGIAGIKAYGKENSLVFDVKNLFAKNEVDWRL